ncbi:FmdB family zinc ribbon protein [Lichenifustis flavocetrariae]|uniref:Zinc ribbon domain-containing protein n=1 Tax=Lichenifustis flavocetrariae TaxID=2949735 RepID=A0AA41Z1D2_9HYPH|nr:FmdB family zinc ribbon protein [Lichenifustis flavocetrariae]MCW6511182.1 zinc ribbon domain-containing protein [Lichenifustis flavocetrariae]
MPRYTYECAACGSFDESRPMAAYSEPFACPHCGDLAPRAMAAARIGGGAARAPAGAAAPSRRHSAGCGCCSPRLSGAMRAEAVAAGAPRRGPAPTAGSFLTRE